MRYFSPLLLRILIFTQLYARRTIRYFETVDVIDTSMIIISVFI